MAKSEGMTARFTTETVGELLAIVSDHRNGKSTKQAALNRIREIEAKTKTRLVGDYNGGPRNPSEIARLEEESELS